jgi:oligosaccharide repeat unit polymerase
MMSEIILLGGSMIVALPLLGAGVVTGRSDLVYLAVAILMPVPLLALTILRGSRFDLFEPINVMAGALIFGTTLRGLYVVFFPNHPRAQFLMMGQTFSELNANVFWILLGVILFCIGYGLNYVRAPAHLGLFQPRRIDPSRFKFILTVCLILSIIGCVAYINTNGINLLGDILGQSRKRVVVVLNALGDEVYAGGWQPQLARTGLYAGAVLAGAMISRVIRPTVYRFALMIALFFFGSVVPFFGQVRTPVILTVFSVFVFSYYYRKIKFRYAVVGVLAIALFASTMGQLRETNVYGSASQSGFVDTTIGSGNGFDTIRAAAILDRVHSRGLYLDGSSYLAIPFFWLPRQIWPDKPDVGLGDWVKEKLFGLHARQSGWPPGFVAEAYINFGLIGIALIPFLAGLAMRWFYEAFRPHLGRSFLATTFYSLILYKIGFDSPSLTIGQGIITGLLSALPGVVIVYFSSRKIVRRPSGTLPRRPGVMAPQGAPRLAGAQLAGPRSPAALVPGAGPR